MKLLVIGPNQSNQAQSPEGQARQALQAAQVEGYAVLTPKAGESKVTALLRMWRQAALEDFDTVSAQDPFFVGVLAWRIARRARARLQVQVHADLEAQSLLRRMLARFVLHRADSVRVVSERIKKQVGECGVRVPIAVLPLYVDLEPYRRVARAPTPGLMLWIGRFEAEKDPLAAIEVLKKVQAQGTEASLIMLGAGSLEPVLRAAAKDLPVSFPGWQSALPYLAKASVVLCTSKQESWGLSIIEALAAEVPVVAPNVGVAREAGATVVERDHLAEAVASALASGTKGELRLSLLSQEEWVRAWRASL